MQYEVQKKIAGRIVTLRSELEDKYKSGRVSALASRQLQWLNDHHGHSQSNEHQMQ
jgi:hypothetical protein